MSMRANGRIQRVWESWDGEYGEMRLRTRSSDEVWENQAGEEAASTASRRGP
jgi:hypothetical protein